MCCMKNANLTTCVFILFFGSLVAILHNDNRLFVLFGVNADGASTDDFYVFDYKNREWEGSSGGGTGGNGPSGGSGGGGSGGNKLSGGGIAGIVIAILVILGVRKLQDGYKEMTDIIVVTPPDYNRWFSAVPT